MLAARGWRARASGKPGVEAGRGAPWLRLAAAVRVGGRPADARSQSGAQPAAPPATNRLHPRETQGRPAHLQPVLIPDHPGHTAPSPRAPHVSFPSRATSTLESTLLSVTLQICSHHPRTPNYLTADSHPYLYRPPSAWSPYILALSSPPIPTLSVLLPLPHRLPSLNPI